MICAHSANCEFREDSFCQETSALVRVHSEIVNIFEKIFLFLNPFWWNSRLRFCWLRKHLLLPFANKRQKTKFNAVELKFITELCRTDGQKAMDRRLWLGWNWVAEQESYQKDTDSTVQTTCLFFIFETK